MDRLKGKVALVTGAAGSFGRAITAAFVAEGARVLGTDSEADGLAALTEAHGDAAAVLRHDVTDEAQWAAAVAAAREAFGGLHIVVNNAGLASTGEPQDPERVSLAQWRAVNAVNVEGVLLGCQAAIGAMKETGGAIVNISSLAALNPSPRMAAYGASKAAVRHLTRTVAMYCAEQGYPIRCNSVHPGWFPTPMVRASRTPEELEVQRRAIPMGRFGEPEEVAKAVLYLASDEAAYVTGAKLVIDGGVAMR